MSQTFSYYEILEIAPSSSSQEIIIAYHKARSAYSQDNPALYTMFSSMEAAELLKIVEEAYAALGNSDRRRIYDESLGYNQQIDSPIAPLSSFTPKKINTIHPDENSQQVTKNHTINLEMEKHIMECQTIDGFFLKKVREYKGFSINDVCSVTRIKKSYIKNIEEHNFDELPAPVFIRGFIKQIAKCLNIDESKASSSYMSMIDLES